MSDKRPQTPEEWLKAIHAGHCLEEDWRTEVGKIIDLYSSRGNRIGGGFVTGRDNNNVEKCDYNILFANTQVLFSAVYSNAPRPDVRRRFRDKDKIARVVSEVIERCLSYSIDSMDWDGMMRYLRLDYLLGGRSIVRVRYEPKFKPAEKPSTDGEPPEPGKAKEPPEPELVYQTVTAEPWPYQDFARSYGTRWDRVEWIAFRHWMPKREAEHEFDCEFPQGHKTAEYGHKIPKDAAVEQERSIEVWELWHKPTRKVYFISEEDKSKFLREQDDPLRLTGFFPIPGPLYSVPELDTLIPVPEYQIYQDLAEELQTVTDRLNKIERSIRVRGLYDASLNEAKELFEAPDTDMIPALNAAALRKSGGIEAGIWMHDNQPAAQVLQILQEYRQGLIQAIYEITGISDIVRGSTEATETLGAQQLKARYNSLRIEPRQNAVAAFLRDILRLWSEIICEHFSLDTLKQMTGLKLLDTPEMPADQMWQIILDTMRNEVQLAYRIDIETDSTIADLTMQDQEMLNELLGAVSAFTQTMAPLIMAAMSQSPQMGQSLLKISQTLLMSVVRRAKLGPQVEDAFDQLAGGGGVEESLAGQDPAMNAGVGAAPGMQLPAAINAGAPAVSPEGQGQGQGAPAPDGAMVSAYADVMRVTATLSELGEQVAQSVTLVGQMVQGVSESPVMSQIAALAESQAAMAQGMTQALNMAAQQNARASIESVEAVRGMTQTILALASAPARMVYNDQGQVVSMTKTPMMMQ